MRASNTHEETRDDVMKALADEEEEEEER